MNGRRKLVNIKELVDIQNGTQSRRIFCDREIYELELERVFARCWLFLTHESLIPKVGDFVVTKMGEDEVIVWRQRDGSVKVFLNQCRHRGMKLCMAEAGNARGLPCGYHGWAYGVDGKLESVPAEKEAYGPAFDRSQWGLRPVPKVESYRGFIFGCMDGAAPSLKDYLGDAAWYMDIWADVLGGVELLGPPSRSIIRANWKVPAENFVGDPYHVPWTHVSVFQAMIGSPPPKEFFAGKDAGIQVTTKYGHGLGVNFGFGSMLLLPTCPELGEWLPRRQAEMEAKKGSKAAKLVTGQWNASIFPNCSYLIGTNVFKVWNPLGPDRVEIMTWAIADKEMSADLKRRMKAAVHRNFGTAGMLEADDIDNLEYANIPNRGYVTRQGRLNSQMGLGEAREDPDYPGVVGDYMNELAYRSYYQFYADCLSSDSWKELETKSANWKEALLRK
jgi:3-phenylpropionate/trans-cinnamate dioxygenase alpha subunit